MRARFPEGRWGRARGCRRCDRSNWQCCHRMQSDWGGKCSNQKDLAGLSMQATHSCFVLRPLPSVTRSMAWDGDMGFSALDDQEAEAGPLKRHNAGCHTPERFRGARGGALKPAGDGGGAPPLPPPPCQAPTAADHRLPLEQQQQQQQPSSSSRWSLRSIFMGAGSSGTPPHPAVRCSRAAARRQRRTPRRPRPTTAATWGR